MNKVAKIGYFLGMILFLASFALPTVQVTKDIQLNGFYAFGINAAMLIFIENGLEYFVYIFSILTNVWVVFLLIRFWRKNEKRVLTFFIGLLAILSAMYWYFVVEDKSILLYGFWIWIGGVALVSIANILKKKQIA